MQCQRIVKLHRVFSSFRDQDGICTVNEISPGFASRQCSDRYTIRAGRNFMSECTSERVYECEKIGTRTRILIYFRIPLLVRQNPDRGRGRTGTKDEYGIWNTEL